MIWLFHWKVRSLHKKVRSFHNMVKLLHLWRAKYTFLLNENYTDGVVIDYINNVNSIYFVDN